MTPPFSPDTLELLLLLHRHDVRYVVAGGEAVIFYGHVRLTGDIDLFYDASPPNAARLFEVLVAFWGGAVPGLSNADELTAADLVLQFGRPPNRIDLLSSLSGVTFEQAWAGRESREVWVEGETVVVPYIGLDVLMANKRATGRPKDLEDLRFLQARREA